MGSEVSDLLGTISWYILLVYLKWTESPETLLVVFIERRVLSSFQSNLNQAFNQYMLIFIYE